MTRLADPPQLATEVSARATLDAILYAQCWEDADILLEGLDVQAGDVCLSVTAAGDNTLALLTRDPRRVLAVDLNPSQLACLEIRVAALRTLDHDEFLELMGSRQSDRRRELYQKCRSNVRSRSARDMWDRLVPKVEQFGVGGVGKFERYWRIFRRWVLPWIHRQSVVTKLLAAKSKKDRRAFYDDCWNNRRWRTLVRAFGSRRVLSWIGREPAFFAYADGSPAEHVLRRTAYALTELSPADNPFLQWILKSRHGAALPLAYRPEHYDTIRNNLDRLQWKQCSVEQMAVHCATRGEFIDRFNLSDIFEYMSVDNQRAALLSMVQASRRGSRMVFWNMMVPRPVPRELADRLISLEALANELHARDKAFFYSCLHVAEVR